MCARESCKAVRERERVLRECECEREGVVAEINRVQLPPQIKHLRKAVSVRERELYV